GEEEVTVDHAKDITRTSRGINSLVIVVKNQSYIKALRKDLWPTSSEEGIHVLHGRTMTTPMALEKCLKSIKEHAFVKSPYLVIITLEDHLTPNRQAKVAE
ncbi:hypothetical protein M8C21_006944, partial [Ambrosia artemisiifolia]